jgi:hypothetical protein
MFIELVNNYKTMTANSKSRRIVLTAVVKLAMIACSRSTGNNAAISSPSCSVSESLGPTGVHTSFSPNHNEQRNCADTGNK